MKSGWKSSALIYVAIIIAGAVILFNVVNSSSEPHEISLSQAIEISKSNNIEKMVIEPEKRTMVITAGGGGASLRIRDVEDNLVEVTGGTELTVDIAGLNLAELQELGFVLPVEYATKSNSGISWGSVLINFLPLLLFGGLLFFLFRSARGANSQALSFARSKARLTPANTPTVTFDDVAGVEEAKEELREVVDFLNSRERFQTLGARIPRGVLLIGPPGTGKTLLAKAVAGQAGVPFFSISGSEFVEMFVGVGASRVRDLFDQAKRNRPCIIFIDEIDAVGRHRGAGLGGSHDEREQTLNQILTEMDGFDTNTGVIVLAATNRPDILDPALLRPGRFDRRVILDRPDINGRKAILKVHSNGKPLAEDVDLEVLAKQTVGFSGADLANLINEAAILAARRDKKVIEMVEMDESVDRVIAGPERKSRKISAKEKEITAYHEAGHTLVAKMLPNADPVHKVSIVARGMMGGYTRLLPTEDRYMMTRSQFEDVLATLLAGHVAEEIIFKEASTGPKDDIERATKMARKMVTDYGMSELLGPRTFGHKEEMVFLGREISEQRDYSEKVAHQIDDEVRKIIDNAYNVAKKVLLENKARLIHLGQKLVIEETLEGAELETALTEPLGKAKAPRKAKASKKKAVTVS